MSLAQMFRSMFRRDAGYYFDKGRAALAAGDPERALALFERSAGLEPDGMLRFNIAERLTEASAAHPEVRNAAIHYLNEAISKLGPTHGCRDAALLMRGNLRVRLGLLREAVSDYDKVLQIRPDSMDAYYRRGVAHWKSGDLRRAEDDLSKAIAVAPDPAFAVLPEAALAKLRRDGADGADRI